MSSPMGTESEEHVNILHQMGCGYAQGYFFSLPLDETAANEMLSANVAAVKALPLLD
jgi:EAL domain-containing protein (putative c-di-GMP-specific phosphodiesterase class I)